MTEEEKQKKCRHRRISKEYHLGAQTGDYVCQDCGKTEHGKEWANLPDEPANTCTHPSSTKEVTMGQKSGDRKCDVCGAIKGGPDWPENEEQ